MQEVYNLTSLVYFVSFSILTERGTNDFLLSLCPAFDCFQPLPRAHVLIILMKYMTFVCHNLICFLEYFFKANILQVSKFSCYFPCLLYDPYHIILFCFDPIRVFIVFIIQHSKSHYKGMKKMIHF